MRMSVAVEQAELELRVGDDDAARGGVAHATLVDVEREFAKLRDQIRGR